MKAATILLAALPALDVLAQTVKPADPSARMLLAPTPSPNAAWVTRVYQDLLGRAPEASSLNTFASQLDHGATRAQVATQIVSSAEYRSRVVNDLYELYLHRAADPGAVSFWVGRIGAGGYLAVQKGILSSAEYLAARGAGSVDKFLDALYQDVLGRPADPGIRASVLKDFGGGGVSQKSLVELVVGSGEGRAALVKQLYQKLLRRPADASGEASFAGQLAGGASAETVLVEFLSSNEYFQRRP